MEIREALQMVEKDLKELIEDEPFATEDEYEKSEGLLKVIIEVLENQLEHEENKPLTLEQLNNTIGEFVFVRYKNGKVICDQIRYIDNSYGGFIGGFIHLHSKGGVFNFNNFEFYKYKPKEHGSCGR